MAKVKKTSSKPRTRTVTRSAKTGRFVKSTAAKRRPSVVVVNEVKTSSSGSPVEVARSTTTGRFVRKSTAKRHPTRAKKELIKR